ncbi:hypothetical protein M426DRAFT_17182 [Hypoxylon sp. CI-4A]|nr:hypothetical protein M426DRAFT_17182 [Hypoxylon sp. CI-4A]
MANGIDLTPPFAMLEAPVLVLIYIGMMLYASTCIALGFKMARAHDRARARARAFPSSSSSSSRRRRRRRQQRWLVRVLEGVALSLLFTVILVPFLIAAAVFAVANLATRGELKAQVRRRWWYEDASATQTDVEAGADVMAGARGSAGIGIGTGVGLGGLGAAGMARDGDAENSGMIGNGEANRGRSRSRRSRSRRSVTQFEEGEGEGQGEQQGDTDDEVYWTPADDDEEGWAEEDDERPASCPRRESNFHEWTNEAAVQDGLLAPGVRAPPPAHVQNSVDCWFYP